ncbi:uncharacterized protein CELE_F49C5.12 [Caenorhabditis elegans]|uniref:Secreted protein n=1 Tax=Caenorhabditis elegans TaxID=6239 RepID=B9WRT7_CAEEL|nr:Secreted protein [Caenorhabditis elegans]CAX32483.1 Secreted protein [Caenorhabditis elegans]|eukprot:NP_001254348.1 Uncharacterized protein CELE_F49C5.12 [Caenorhabditis elegans]
MIFALLLAPLMCTAQTIPADIYPLNMNFSVFRPTASLDVVYSMLSRYTTNKATPIAFIFDEKITSNPRTWMDPCYERFFETPDAYFTVFWKDVTTITMYCEVYVLSSVVASKIPPTFPANMLVRIEEFVPRCP